MPAPPRPTTLFDLDRNEMETRLAEHPRYRTEQLWSGLYQTLAPVEEISTLPAALKQELTSELREALREVTQSVADGGDTVKTLWELDDGYRVESVLMHYPKRSTICVSTQAGCAMACEFCATGQAGFDRHLTVGEIVEQIVQGARRAAPRRLSNVVFMGMGEPLANLDATWSAVERCHRDLGIGARHLTISTVGLVPGIKALAERELPISLAVSLHAANDELRDRLVPINRRYPIRELVAACVEHRRISGRRVSFEWAMIDGVNDRSSDADELAELARQARAHVNLIPLNPTPGYPTVGSSRARIDDFVTALERGGVTVTVRANRGTSIDAACGQLSASEALTIRPSRLRPNQAKVLPD